MRPAASSVEVAVPCFNEVRTIAKVVRDFRRVLPEARVVVYDNGSTDGSAEAALAAGAEARRVNRRGKGFVSQAIFEQSRDDVILMVDGDDTYSADDAPALLAPLLRGEADMTIGTRLEQSAHASFRPFHRFGNRLFTILLNATFGASFRDILSGYRGFSRRFLSDVPLITCGFETETELLLQALELGLVVHEIPVRYQPRPSGSQSKLRTIRDGYRILMTIVVLLRDHRPLLVFGTLSAMLAAVAALSRSANIAVVVAALMMLLAGLILNTINTRFRELQSLLRRPRMSPSDSEAEASSAAVSEARALR